VESLLNAVEAAPGGGELTVTTAAAGCGLVLQLSDTGEGIAAANLGHVFEPFFPTKSDGSGIGLARVHRIVQDHGAEFDIESALE
jgi:two-component system sensor histidine kinase HydH